MDSEPQLFSKKSDSFSVAAVIPRYGASLGGGAETLVRSLLMAIASQQFPDWPGNVRVEVWTTCARDHRTWENFYEPGLSEEDGLVVRRFAVDSRDIHRFIHWELAIHQGWPLQISEQFEWLGSGVNSRALYAHIARHGQEFDHLFFAPYLFPTSFWGPLIYPDRSILLPCLHNEKYAYQSCFQYVFSKVKRLAFNSQPELVLAEELYARLNIADKSRVVGMPFVINSFSELPDKSARELELELARLGEQCGQKLGSFVLYSGRKEQGKNLDLLLDYFERLAGDELVGDLKLVLIGSGDINFREALPSNVIDLGFVSESEKQTLMRNAVALLQPSVNESFSIVLMEAWLRGTPVVVHGQCTVTKDHVLRSGGGLYFESEEEFRGVLQELVTRPELCHKLGQQGHAYVAAQYSYQAVGSRLAELLSLNTVRLQRYGSSQLLAS